MDLNTQEIKKYLNKNLKVETFNTIDSTSTYARKMVPSYQDSFLVASLHQTSGRGRKGNSYLSQNESMYFTLVTKINHFPQEDDLYTLKAVVAVVKTFNELYHIKIQIKWVNDLFFEFKKCGGILIESIPYEDHYYLLMGIGVNVNTPLDKKIENIATSLEIDNFNINRTISSIINCFYSLNDQETLMVYKENLLLLNKVIEFDYNFLHYQGKCLGINHLGNLEVELADQSILTLNSGEVSLGSKNIVNQLKK